MTLQVKLSQVLALGFADFKAEVAAYANEVKAWINQEKMVEETKDRNDPIERYAPYPHPVVHPLVQEAVNQTGEPDFELIDDSQDTDAQKLFDAKGKLFTLIVNQYEDETRKIIPKGKEALISLHEERINTADAAVKLKQQTDWIAIQRPFTLDELETFVIAARSPEDQQFMTELTDIKAQIKALQWWRAEQESEIADLTIETVAAWTPAPIKS